MNCITNTNKVFSKENLLKLNHKDKLIFFTHI